MHMYRVVPQTKRENYNTLSCRYSQETIMNLGSSMCYTLYTK